MLILTSKKLMLCLRQRIWGLFLLRAYDCFVEVA